MAPLQSFLYHFLVLLSANQLVCAAPLSKDGATLHGVDDTTVIGQSKPVIMFSKVSALPDNNFADPAIVTDDRGVYWSFATDNVEQGTSPSTKKGEFNVQVANSSDFTTWEYFTADALPVTGKWTANPPHVWAPDVVRLDDGSYVLYYAATPASDLDSHCIGAATSKTPQGPYKALDAPLHCPTAEGGAIDPSGFRDPATGKHYVMWKIDGNHGQPGGACGNDNPHPRATPIRMQELEADGVTLVGGPVQILDRDASDGPLVEAPSMVAVPHAAAVGGFAYILFYSSHCYITSAYNVRYAVSTRGIFNGITPPAANASGIPHADYTKHTGALMDTQGIGLIGPGGLDAHPDGRHVVFHAAREAENPGSRRMHFGLININQNLTVTI